MIKVPRWTSTNPGRRILVYGVTGSGKSTAAQRIAARTLLPLTLADELTWAIIRWHFQSFGRKRGRMRAWAASAEGPVVLLFTRSRDLEMWIDTLGDRSADGATAPGAEH